MCVKVASVMCDGEFKISGWSFAVYLCKKGIMETLARFLHLIKLQVKFSMKIYRDGNANMHSNKV